MCRSFPIPLIAAAAIPLLAACGDAPDQAEVAAEAEAERRAAAADSVMLAAEMYDPAVFDTITWESPEAKLERGKVVFGISCSKCHGPSGAGDGEFVMRGDTLRPPSFQAADWEYADDVEGLRRQVFTGTEENMPHWGFYGLKYRDIDAAAAYIREVLRAM
jgi:mono/diheme cytochrome c family protein